ncbi:HAD-IA family hydrolase [Kurthia sibirica]|uniref:Phosphoglycolate phosphatase n=1 Tax=Kurthia sibirica TaxID=202750 RepID=A0A2U3AH62_9BACL|nr:HAD-IA family hydrolase [Kurthia sibirica]PWI23896.1 phosphoglycolate phosphatase [Kurthia sibirica]GEK34918.1 phosphoglycolate phosphatase [Kurthia sibirica]
MKILWDFDGTIMDTYPAYSAILFEILEGKFSIEEIYRQLKISQSHAIDYFGLTAEQATDMKAQSRTIQQDVFKPFECVRDVLDQAELNVIMTHMERATVERLLKETQLNHYFIEIVAGDDGFPRKPDATSYKYLHDKYGIDLAIGDRPLDLIPAKSIGISTIMFQGDCDAADYTLADYCHFSDLDI